MKCSFSTLTLLSILHGFVLRLTKATLSADMATPLFVPETEHGFFTPALHPGTNLRIRGLKPKSSKSTKSSKSSSKSCKGSKSSKSCDSKRVLPELMCNKSTNIPTGALLSVNMDLNGIADVVRVLKAEGEIRENSTIPLSERQLRGNHRFLQALDAMGTVSLAKGVPGNPTTHFTFVMDVSGSTENENTCANRTVLECEQEAILKGNAAILNETLGVCVSLVTFGGDAHIEDLSNKDGDQFIVDPKDFSIQISASNAATSFYLGMEKAMNITMEANGSPNVSNSVILFLTDGEESGPAKYMSAKDIVTCNDHQITVFIFTIGSNAQHNNELETLAESTGGSRTHLENPADIVDILARMINPKTLDSANVTIFGNPVQQLETSPTLPVFPEQTPVTVSAAMDISRARRNLQSEGNNEVCLKGQSGSYSAKCCINVTAV